MDDAVLIETHGRLVAAGGADAALDAVRALEAVDPDSEEVWRRLHRFFTDLPSPVWADIMTIRFLKRQPAHLQALIVHTTYLIRTPSRQEEGLVLLRGLDPANITDAHDLFMIATLFAQRGLLMEASQFIDLARDVDVTDLRIRAQIAHHYINLNDLPRAKAELQDIYVLAKDDVTALTTVLFIALRMNYAPFADRVLQDALRVVKADDHAGKGYLIVVAAKLGRSAILHRLMPQTDFRKITQSAELVALIESLEGLGFADMEGVIIEQGLALDPSNAILRAAQRRHTMAGTAHLTTAIPAVAAAEPQTTLVRTMKDRLRDGMFWR